jgi:hypothetical protein
MSWVRDVLTGAEAVDFRRHTRDEFHWLSNQKYGGEAAVAKLDQGFAGLLSDPDPRLRGAAVCWFAHNVARRTGPTLVEAYLAHPELYEGVPQPWLEDAGDQGRLMVQAIAKNALDVPGGLDLVRAEALEDHRGQNVVAFLVHADPAWVRDHLAQIATSSPAAIDVLFFHLGLLGVELTATVAHLATRAPEAGGALLKALHARGEDLEQAVLRLQEQVGAERVTLWVNAVVEDEDERARTLGLL